MITLTIYLPDIEYKEIISVELYTASGSGDLTIIANCKGTSCLLRSSFVVARFLRPHEVSPLPQSVYKKVGDGMNITENYLPVLGDTC